MAGKKKNELATITTSEFTGFIYSPIAAELSKPFSRKIFLAETHVAGCRYVRNIEKYLSKLQKGDRLILLREPKNEHDELAILVKDERKHKLGYIPRAQNQVMAHLMDAGKYLYGEVVEIMDPYDEQQAYQALLISVYMDD